MSLPRIESSVTVVTGASSGIGRAAALAFAGAGARVVLASRDETRLRQLEREIVAGSGNALAVPADVTDTSQVEALVRTTLDRFGRIDILVCNAGVGLYSLVKDLPEEALRRVFEVNFFGVVRCVQAVLPSMIERRSGLIQVVSSIIGLRSVPGYAGYCATKFALSAVTESLRVELAGTGLRVQTIYPALTDTEFSTRSILRDASRRAGPMKAMPAEKVARRMLKAARSGRRDTVISAGGRLLVLLNRVSPTLTDRLLARVMGTGGPGVSDALPH